MTPGDLSLLLDDAALMGVDKLELVDQWRLWSAANQLLNLYEAAVRDGDRSTWDIVKKIEEIA